MRALIIVDVQNDFCEGGLLPVHGATEVVRSITDYLHGLDRRRAGYNYVVATQDAHIDPGAHFGEHPDGVSSWPRHCVADSPGADFASGLDTTRIDAVFRKGAYGAGYSGFDGSDAGGTALADWLHQRDVDAVDVVGIATDFCVRHTAEDAVRAGFATRVLAGLTVGVAAESTAAALAAMRAAGVTVVGAA